MGLASVFGALGGFAIGGPTGAQIGAGIGGALDSRKRQKKVDKQVQERNAIEDARYERAEFNQSPQGIRERAEAAGFNPLLFVGPGTGTGPTPSGSSAIFGNEASGHGALIADAFRKEEQVAIQKSQLELENQRLQQLVEQATLRPEIGGIYEQQDRLGNSASIDRDRVRTQRSGPADGVEETTIVHNPERTSVEAFGHRLAPDDEFSDAEEFEKRYGDLVSAGVGVAVLSADISKNVHLGVRPRSREFARDRARVAREQYWADQARGRMAPLSLRRHSPDDFQYRQ